MSAERISRRALLGGLAAGAIAPPGWAQGFAGLGAEAQGYAAVTPGRALAFPADLGSHPKFRTEWWYVTANLRSADGRDYGAQWTLFRQALRPAAEGEGWADPHAWMGHAAITGADTHRFAERLGRGGIGQAGAQAAPFCAWIDDWTLGESGGAWAMEAAGEDFAYRLALTQQGPFVPQGDNGYSVKSNQGQASYYFSQPFFAAEGALTISGEEIPVTGRAWLDREWSSQPLAPGQRGWDWLSLHLASGEKLMAFALRSDDAAPFLSGTWIATDGTPAPLPGAELSLMPQRERRIAGRRIPTRWRVQVPMRGFDVTVTPLNVEAWNAGSVPYWEGPVRAEGSHAAQGYLELTGY